MLKRGPGRPRLPRYEALPHKPRNDRAWMVYDARTGRLLAMEMHRNAAERLAHTLNVGDLSEDVIDYGGDL